VKNVAPNYDERRYGFANFLEAVRAAGRAGLFRLERNRQGILRIFAGAQFPRPLQVIAQGVNGEVAVEPEVAESVPVLEEAMLPQSVTDAAEAPLEVLGVSDTPSEEPLVLTAESAVLEAVPEPHKPPAKRRTRSAGTSAKKKSTAGRKAKKKAAAGDDEPF
jgi:hypothetical protein